jgi:copper chaperone CopZ
MHEHQRIMKLSPSLPVLAFGLLLIQACSNAEQSAEQPAALPGVERVVKEVVITSGAPMAIADLGIEGMSCEMMCGGSIKKVLAQLPGIASTEIQFIEGDERDHAIVTYDESKVSDTEMVKAIQALHDGQYKVLSVNITKQVLGTAADHDGGNAEQEEPGVSVELPTSDVILPSIITLLTSVLRR